jgi:hypothetical protein
MTIDINAAFQKKVLAESDARLAEVLEEARAMRQRIDETLDDLELVVPALLTEAERTEHEDLICKLVQTWIRLHPCTHDLISLDEKAALDAKLAPKGE